MSTQEAVVADQPRAGLLALGHRLEHGRCLVDEAFATGQYPDNPRLATLDDVREVADAAVAVPHLGDRRQ
jgi:hypothetical protein